MSDVPNEDQEIYVYYLFSNNYLIIFFPVNLFLNWGKKPHKLLQGIKLYLRHKINEGCVNKSLCTDSSFLKSSSAKYVGSH